MKIIICGIGKYGVSLIGKLALSGHDVTVIDCNMQLIKELSENFDVKAYCESVFNIDFLNSCELFELDLLICLADNDIINMTLSRLYKQLFNIKKTIVFISDNKFIRSEYHKIYEIDAIMSPELELSLAIQNIITFSINNLRVVRVSYNLIVTIVSMNKDILSQEIYQYLSDTVLCLGIIRNKKFIKLSHLKKIRLKDEIIFLTTDVSKSIDLRRITRDDDLSLKRAVILCDDYHLTTNIIRIISDFLPEITLINMDRKNSQLIANTFSRISVMQADSIDESTLEEAMVELSDFIISANSKDYQNIFSAFLATQANDQLAIILLNNDKLLPLAKKLALDNLIQYQEIVMKRLLTMIAHIDHGIFNVENTMINFIELISDQSLNFIRQLSKDIMLIAVYRDNKLQLISNKFLLHKNDGLFYALKRESSQ